MGSTKAFVDKPENYLAQGRQNITENGKTDLPYHTLAIPFEGPGHTEILWQSYKTRNERLFARGAKSGRGGYLARRRTNLRRMSGARAFDAEKEM